jgi:hypothetical protein
MVRVAKVEDQIPIEPITFNEYVAIFSALSEKISKEGVLGLKVKILESNAESSEFFKLYVIEPQRPIKFSVNGVTDTVIAALSF